MYNQMHKWWWKILAAVLLVYSITAGLLIPVGPGVKDISPKQVTAGKEVTIRIQGYNAHFLELRESQQAFLRISGQYICAEKMFAENNNLAYAIFAVPREASGKYFRLLLNNDVDGTFAYQDSMRVQTSENEETAGFGITYCEPDISQNDPSYINFPYRPVLYETIRNLFFHVPLWFGMTFLLLVSFIMSILYLHKSDLRHDTVAAQMAHTGLLFGVLGFLTGALWGHYTWGDLSNWLLGDSKILGALIAILMYLAYFILRSSMNDLEKRAKLAAVYNIFAFAMFIVFIFVMPRMTDTLHPGSGGNPGLNIYDVDDRMRLVFYPAVAGWILVGLWLASVRIRICRMNQKLENQ